MKKKLTLIPVQPSGKEVVGAFVDGRDPKTGKRFGEFRQTEHNTHPTSPNGEWLHTAFRKAGMSIRERAEFLGVSVTEASKLERGELTLSESDWDTLKQELIQKIVGES